MKWIDFFAFFFIFVGENYSQIFQRSEKQFKISAIFFESWFKDANAFLFISKILSGEKISMTTNKFSSLSFVWSRNWMHKYGFTWRKKKKTTKTEQKITEKWKHHE